MLHAILFAFLILDTCENLYQDSEPEINVGFQMSDSLTVRVEAKELSEDLHVLSSKNDEILLLIYEQIDSVAPMQLVLKSQLKFDQTNRVQEFKAPLEKWPIVGELLLFLIEQDSETPLAQLDPIISIQRHEIINAYRNGDYVMMEEYLGDEDVLGIKHISNWDQGNVNIEFKGYYKLDKFEYSIDLIR